ncbi:MAG: hypothetical protein ACKVS9_19205 [Phycisphaerae bacterium]
MPETRYIFWDGVPNLDPATGVRIPNTDWYEYLDEKDLKKERDKWTEREVSRTSSTATTTIPLSVQPPRIGVKIESVDSWFVPITDMLAIKLELTELATIRCMMVRISRCKNPAATTTGPTGEPRPAHPRAGQPKTADDYEVVAQLVLDGPEIDALPKTDISRADKDRVRRKEERHKAELQAVRCLSHCRVEVWVTDKRDAFMSTKGTDAVSTVKSGLTANQFVTDPPDLTGDKLGKNIAIAGCPVIEDVLSDNMTGLRISNTEPTDAGFYGKEKRTGDGLTALKPFKAKMRWVMYQICAHSQIASTLLEAVAREPAEHQVTMYPSTTLSDFINGTAIGRGSSAELLDDSKIVPLITTKLNELKSGTDTVSNSGDDPVWRQVEKVPDPGVVVPDLDEPAKKDIVAALTSLAVDTGRLAMLGTMGVNKIYPTLATWRDKDIIIATLGELRSRINEFDPPQEDKSKMLVRDANNLKTLIESQGKTIFLRRWRAAGHAVVDGTKVVYDDAKNVALGFASKRLIYRQIGASGSGTQRMGAGCEAHFYFNHYQIQEKLDKDTYGVQYHEPDTAKSTHPVLLDDGIERVVAYAVPAATTTGEGVPQVETPFFVAFAHELVHARRDQLGCNSEWDDILDIPIEQYHPRSLVRKLEAKLRADSVGAADIKDRVDNLISRYANWNREEWDTIEGGGVPLQLPKKLFDELTGRDYEGGVKVIADTDIVDRSACKVKVTENLVRKELGLSLRFHYTPCITKATPATITSVAESKTKRPRKFVKLPNNTNSYRPGEPTPTDVKQAMDRLLQTDGGLSSRSVEPVGWDSNCFLIAPRFNYLMLRCKMVLTGSDDTFATNAYGELIAARTAMLADLTGSPGAHTQMSALYATTAGTDGIAEKRLFVAKLLLLLYKEHGRYDGKSTGGTFSAADYRAVLDRSPAMAAKPPGDSPIPAFATINFTRVTLDELAGLSSGPLPNDKVALYVTKSPLEDPSGHWMHVLIHEPMHAFSYQAGGFTEWDLQAGTQRISGRTNLSVTVTSPTDPDVLFSVIKDIWPNTNMHPLRLTEQVEPQGVTWVAPDGLLKSIENWRPKKTTSEAAGLLDRINEFARPGQATPLFRWLTAEQLIEWKGKLLAKAAGKLTVTETASDVGKFFWEQIVKMAGGGSPISDGHYFSLRGALDEGTTEVLARIVLYRLNHRWGWRVGEIKLLLGVPYYEFPAHLVTRIIRDIDASTSYGTGVRVFVRAFFAGEWAPLNDALATLGTTKPGNRYTPEFWGLVKELLIYPEPYLNTSHSTFKAVQTLQKAFSFNWLSAAQIRTAIGDGSYRDPVIHEYLPGTHGAAVDYDWNPIADLGCGTKTAPINQPCGLCGNPRVDEPVLAARCPCCEDSIEIPSAKVLKA